MASKLHQDLLCDKELTSKVLTEFSSMLSDTPLVTQVVENVTGLLTEVSAAV